MSGVSSPPAVAATQAAIEAETDEDTYLSPDFLKHHPGAAKARINFTGTGVIAINDDRGVSSITDFGLGWYGITFDTAFSDANYVIASTGELPINPHRGIVGLDSANSTASAARIRTGTAFDGGVADLNRVLLAFFGDL